MGILCRRNPTTEFAYDGISVFPLESVFIKMKSTMVDSMWQVGQYGTGSSFSLYTCAQIQYNQTLMQQSTWPGEICSFASALKAGTLNQV